jgi:hypothetical protein
MTLRGEVLIYCPIGALRTRRDRPGPPVPVEQRPVRIGRALPPFGREEGSRSEAGEGAAPAPSARPS